MHSSWKEQRKFSKKILHCCWNIVTSQLFGLFSKLLKRSPANFFLKLLIMLNTHNVAIQNCAQSIWSVSLSLIWFVELPFRVMGVNYRGYIWLFLLFLDYEAWVKVAFLALSFPNPTPRVLYSPSDPWSHSLYLRSQFQNQPFAHH